MSHRLIKAGLRAISERGSFPASKKLLSYLQKNNIYTRPKGSCILLLRPDRKELERALERDFQVPPGTTIDAWDGKSRTEAHALEQEELDPVAPAS